MDHRPKYTHRPYLGQPRNLLACTTRPARIVCTGNGATLKGAPSLTVRLRKGIADGRKRDIYRAVCRQPDGA